MHLTYTIYKLSYLSFKKTQIINIKQFFLILITNYIFRKRQESKEEVCYKRKVYCQKINFLVILINLGDIWKKSFVNKFKSYKKNVSKQRQKSLKNISSNISSTRKNGDVRNRVRKIDDTTTDKKLNKSVDNYSNIKKAAKLNKAELSANKSSPKLKYSVSRGDLSTDYTKNVAGTAKYFKRLAESVRNNNGKKLNISSYQKSNSPKKSPGVLSTVRRIDNSILNDIADETSINVGNGFMDGYYASNGYFSYSQTAEQMRAKDSLFDKLQTFVDERLLEIAAKIGTKQKANDEK